MPYALIIDSVVTDIQDNAPENSEDTWILTESGIRGNLAKIGYTYDSRYDVFYPPCPGSTWLLDSTTWSWVLLA